MSQSIEQNFLESGIKLFRYYKKLGEGAIAQLSEEEVLRKPNELSNSIALIVHHLSGNMLSRWTDFLTSDGEKPTRNRDGEFEEAPKTRTGILELWDAGWKCFLGALEGLSDADITKTITIRGEAHSVMQAINRQVAHYCYHVGQIAFLARHYAGPHWKSLTIPKKKSQEFNADVAGGKKSQR